MTTSCHGSVTYILASEDTLISNFGRITLENVTNVGIESEIGGHERIEGGGGADKVTRRGERINAFSTVSTGQLKTTAMSTR